MLPHRGGATHQHRPSFCGAFGGLHGTFTQQFVPRTWLHWGLMRSGFTRLLPVLEGLNASPREAGPALALSSMLWT
eukprot:6516719-Alexandrium_andersonii.AAC.1